MKSNAGEQKRNEPLHVSAVKSRLDWMQYKLHEDIFNNEDFEYICEVEKILIVRHAVKWDGAYFRRKNEDVIYIKNSISGTFKTFVEFHELAHFWLHQPEISLMHFFNKSRIMIDKAEHQASVVSACMLIPTTYVESFSTNELLEIYEHKEIIDFRLQIYKECKI